MAQELRIAGGQLPVTHDIAENVKTLLHAIAFAASEQAEILVTPEGSLTGYHPHFDREEANAALATVTAAAQDAAVGLVLGTCWEEADGKVYNQQRFYTTDGQFLGFHSKTLRCGSMTDGSGEINDYAVQDLRSFEFKGIRIGGLICNDMWANPSCTPMPDPHLSQQLSAMGCRVVFHSVNGGRNGGDWSRNVIRPYHETNLRMRAAAGRIWIVTVDNAAPDHWPTSSPGGVIRPNGEWALQAQVQGQQLFAYSIQVDD